MSVPIMIGRYRTGPRLGAGGFAVVWLAHDESLDTTIAIKVMAENWASQGDLRDRFLAEARMLRRAASSRVVQVFDIGELPDGRPYFVMEHADLGTLGDRIAQGRLPLGQALRMTAEIARGAAELHRLDIVHRDLKPSNVLIRSAPDGGIRLLIADLGIAKNLGAGPALTMSVGSTGYMAPEQSMPDSRVDARADVYSLGALGFQLITGQQPGSWGPELPPEGPHPDLPEPVLRLLKQALEWEPSRRWPDATTLAERLDELADEFEISNPAEIVQPPMGRNRVAVVPASNSGLNPESGSHSGPDSRPDSAPGTGPNSGPGRRSASGRRSAAGRRSGSGLHAEPAAAHSRRRLGFLGPGRARGMAVVVGLVLVGLVWVEFRIIGQNQAAKAQSGSSTGKPAVTASSSSVVTPEVGPSVPNQKIPPGSVAIPDLTDGDHFGLLVGSGKGKITVIMISSLVGDEALTKCRKDLGVQVSAKAVCASYYFQRIESSPRTIEVEENASIGYVTADSRAGVLYRQITGANVAQLAAVSKDYQTGKFFYLKTKQNRLQLARQDAAGCNDIDGLVVDGRNEWTTTCINRFD